jgi:hypothetical protein
MVLRNGLIIGFVMVQLRPLELNLRFFVTAEVSGAPIAHDIKALI